LELQEFLMIINASQMREDVFWLIFRVTT